MMVQFGGIEAGGTKFVCGVGSCPEDYKDQVVFDTTTPKKTLHKVIQYFKAQISKYSINAIGIGSFGPIDLNKKNKSFGYITNTPKKKWSNVNVLGILSNELSVPVFIDTDVNVAAIAEHKWGAAQGLDTFIYLTIGTGIGGGGYANGKPMQGLMHSEMGHILIPHNFQEDPFKGVCPIHNDCLEGLACGPAIEERWGGKAVNLPLNHEAWKLEANYLAYALVNYICTLSPQRVIMGGGVMNQNHLFPIIRKRVKGLLNNYIQSNIILDHIEDFIVPPELGIRSGVLGAMALAQDKQLTD